MHLYLLLKPLVLFILFTGIANSIQDDKLMNSFSITTLLDAYRSMCVCMVSMYVIAHSYTNREKKLIYNEKRMNGVAKK